jgi:hypothetical protein
MKTSLKILTVLSLAVIALGLAAGFAGFEMPATLSPGRLLVGYVSVQLLAIALDDYSRRMRRFALAALPRQPVANSLKAVHPLAA